MVTDSEITRFYEYVDSLGLKFPVAAISKATGFSKGNVSQYLNKTMSPSENFMNAVYEKFPISIKNVPRGTIAKEPQQKDIPTKLLADLVQSNLNLSDSNKSLSRSHEELVSMVKKDSTAEEDQYTMEETVALVKGMREYLIELAAEIKKKSPVEISQVLHSKVKVVRRNSGGKTGNPVDAGK